VIVDIIKIGVCETVGLPMEFTAWADIPGTHIIEYTDEFLVLVRRVVYPSDYPVRVA
jgi:hypothetical protein